jgi:hypothetical protein
MHVASRNIVGRLASGKHRCTSPVASGTNRHPVPSFVSYQSMKFVAPPPASQKCARRREPLWYVFESGGASGAEVDALSRPPHATSNANAAHGSLEVRKIDH